MPSQARSCSHWRPPQCCHSHPSPRWLERTPQSDSLSSGNATTASPLPHEASSGLEPAESAAAAAELTRAKDLRQGKQASQRNDRGLRAVRWSEVRQEKVRETALSVAGETGEPSEKRSAVSRAADGDAATASRAASAS
ncbi:unnamed protein product [Alopecurus aequalis]